MIMTDFLISFCLKDTTEQSESNVFQTIFRLFSS